ncbi:GGDEF-domain containing protein [Thalassotalea profundi]|uniref:GGDEF-domain containing protein n=2 Tax=Thalassotalea profundi TaxID=2036687 RepID=A0ABQ3IWS5_9GAMM|nr:GGDEF-domain containing protein [Thalassotalea profundi]
MIIPVILILVLLKPIADISLRYPIILSGALLIQLFAFNQIEDNQFNLVLIGASAFVSAILQISIAEKLTGKKKIIFTLSTFLLLSLFIVGVLILPSEDNDKLWLVFSVINFLLIVIGGLLLHKMSKFHLGREFVIWFLVSVYCIAVYLRSMTTMADYGVIISAIVIYLMFIAHYCRSVVKNNMLKLTTASDKSPSSQGYGNTQHFDPITNLPNYHQSLHCLREFNHHDPSSLAIIVFKPINFAQVNKVLGHQNSDILLLQLAYNIQKSIVDNELLVNFHQPNSPIRIARLQGLDFVVAIDANASHHPIKILVEELCRELNEAVPHALSFKSFSLNFDLKFGVAFVNEHNNDIEQTIAFAGDALLESEQNHQLVWYFNQETAIYTEQKLLIMERLKQDIIDNKLTWLLQPQISLNESQLIGFELLTDWHSTNGNELDMKEFIEIAEYSGEMYHLTRQIIERACKLIASLHRENFYVQVSVNLSSQDALEHDLIEFIEEISDKHYTSLRYLVIELDEALLFKAADKTKLIIDQLKAIGVKVSINNFSGSYEALRYLRRLAIDQVKVDCSQLKGPINEGQSEKTIISALINLIRKMKIPLIATGINNSEIKNTYVDIGGDIGQGNLITNGINLDDVKAWTAQWLKEHVENNSDQG